MNKTKKFISKVTSLMMGFVLVLGLLSFIPPSIALASAEFDEGKAIAQEIDYNTDYTGVLETGDSANWYKLQSKSYTAYYNFILKNIDVASGFGNRDALAFIVYDADGMEVGAAYAASASETTNYVKLEKNQTYYIKAFSGIHYSNNGSYKFSVVPEKDAADVKKDAASISFSTTYKHSFPVSKDVDWFKLKSSSSTDYCKFTLKNINMGKNATTKVWLVVYDSSGTEVDSISAGYASTTTKEIKLKRSKTYYIKCYQDGIASPGDYQFSVKTVSDAGGTKATAQTIKLATTYKYKINGAEDIDWYKIKLTKKGDYKFTLKDVDVPGNNYDDMYMCIYNSSGSRIATVKTYKGKSTTKTLKNLKAGTYYLKIYSKYNMTGNYTFKVAKK